MMTRIERQRFLTLLGQNISSSQRELSNVDVGLFFLSFLTSEEILTVLEERRDLIIRSQEMILEPTTEEQQEDEIQTLIRDHIQTLLEAERCWLDRTLRRLRTPETSARTT